MAGVGGIRDNWQLATGVTRPGATPKPTAIKQTVQETAGRILGTQARDSLQIRTLASDLTVGGVANIPFEGLFASQQYRTGKLKANEYIAQILANSMTFGAWTAGGAIATAALAPFGLPALAVGVVGFAVGMSAQGLVERLFGDRLRKGLANAIPESSVKGLADGFTRFVANPLHDFLWKPLSGTVMDNKIVAAGVAGALALKFPSVAGALGKEALTMAGGLALGLGIEAKVLDPLAGPAPDPFGLQEEPAPAREALAEQAIEPGWVVAFQRVERAMLGRGFAPEQAKVQAQQAFVQAMVEDGADRREAEALVASIASTPDTTGAPHRIGQRLHLVG